MNNVERRYYQYIQEQLDILTEAKELDAKQALAYQVGFLSAQLARAMTQDSHIVDNFRAGVNSQGLTKPR